jgi:ssDNA-binding Zn-finger/Zn-ribbon topoisomerase 1
MQTFVRLLVLFAIASGIIACLYFLGSGELKGRESALLSIVLTGLSILASWVVTAMYAENQHRMAIEEVQEAHKNNLRTYALKAAEKVTNLSNELNRLAAYLQQELDFTEYGTTEEALHAKEERLESSIHIISTLKSVNDTSLSDWQGVIGEELEEQREEKQEREEAAVQRIEANLTSKLAEIQKGQQGTQDIRMEIDGLRRDLRLMVTASGISAPLPRVTRSRSIVESHCPACNAALKYKQKASVKSIKGIKCPQCEARLVARYDEKRGYYLGLRAGVPEKVPCPSCNTAVAIELDPVPGGTANGKCGNCSSEFTAIRGVADIRTRIGATQPPQIPEPTKEIVDLVRKQLPPQPWPTGIHRMIAASLGLPAQTVSKAVNKLISDGVFVSQSNGKIVSQQSPNYPDA